MDKKVIFITGASGGLGTVMSSFFYEQGYRLVLHHHQNDLNLPEDDTVLHVKGDLRNPDAIQNMFQKALSHFGKVDILINNAGVSKSSVSWKTSTENWEETIDINLSAAFYSCKEVIPSMRENNWGRIINISSVVAQSGVVGTVAYAASKAGLIGMTKTLSKELASNNITVNALALGYFNKGMINDVPEEIKQAIIETIPTKKLGDPKSICETISLLLKEEGGYITGQTINLNGGLLT